MSTEPTSSFSMFRCCQLNKICRQSGRRGDHSGPECLPIERRKRSISKRSAGVMGPACGLIAHFLRSDVSLIVWGGLAEI